MQLKILHYFVFCSYVCFFYDARFHHFFCIHNTEDFSIISSLFVIERSLSLLIVARSDQ